MSERRWTLSGLSAHGRRMILLGALLLFAYGFFQQRPAWNELSRYDLVRAIVEQGTTRIDAYHENTGDKAFYAGHWYSDKAPGSALLGVPVYAVLSLTSHLTGGGTPGEAEAVQALTFVESGIATTALVLLLVQFLRPLVDERWALAVGLAYGLGSMAFPFATMFFGHAASAAALFGSFYLLHRHKAQPGPWAPVAAGFLAGWAVLIEIPVALGVAALFVYAMVQGRGVAARFVAGGLPLAAVLLAYNWLTFGGPFSLGYQYATVFSEQNQQGIISIVWPSLERTGELLFSPRGLLRLAPWFALAPLGLVALRGRRELRFELLLALVVCAAFLTYNSGALNPFGGWTPGPRYLLPALPFAAILVALVPVGLRVVAVPLMIAAIGVFLVATVTMPNAPERYEDPLFELWLPRLASGDLAETAAWIRWGVYGYGALAVLVTGVSLAVLAAAVSFAKPLLAAQATRRAAIVLAVMVLLFSLPFPPLAPVAVGWQGDRSVPAVSIAELGHTSTTVGPRAEVELWTRLENRGGAVPVSRVRFTVWRASGEVVWSAWYGEVEIRAGSRQTVRMTWRPDDILAGSYRYGVTVSDASSQVTYAEVLAAGAISLP